MRHLQGGHCDIALADGIVYRGGGFVWIGDVAGGFVAQASDAGLAAKTQQFRVARLQVGVALVHQSAHFPEKWIAGCRERPAQVDKAGRGFVFQQAPVVADRPGIAKTFLSFPGDITEIWVLRRRCALGRGGQKRHDFVYRAGRVLFGDGFVGEGSTRIAIEPRRAIGDIVLCIAVEDMRVECGITGHRQYFAGVDVQGDDSAAQCDAAPIEQGIINGVRHGLRGDLLQVAVDGQRDRPRRHAGRVRQFAHDRTALFNDLQRPLRLAGKR